MSLKFQFTDYLLFDKPTKKQTSEWKDALYTNVNPNIRRGLLVKMEASHAAYLNLNDRIYIPSRMAEGVRTFRVGEKPTKIMKHHELDTDPVGIVKNARFVPTIPDELKNNPDVINLMSSSAPIRDQIKSVRNLWKKGIFHQEGWRGLGYTELYAAILDSTTIEQIQDGRFDAVSTNFRSPSSVHCLICGKNWASTDACEHDVYGMYEDESEDGQKLPALPIPGIHQYVETSLVSKEGDPLATVTVADEIDPDNKNNKTYFLPDGWAEKTNVTSMEFEFKDFEEDKMAEKKKTEVVLTDAEQKIFDMIKNLYTPTTEDPDTELKEIAKQLVSLKDANGFLPYQEEASLDEETAVKYTLENILVGPEAKVEDSHIQEIDALYQEEFAKMHDEKLLTDVEYEDAKLSTEKRKSLPGSAFCGPDKSFPVPDCKHVTAAKRLIGRYKGPGDKSRILACVSRKAKALGCGSDSLDSQEPAVTIPDAQLLPCNENTLKDMADQDLRNLYMSAELELVGRGQKMAYECKECALEKEKVEKAKEELVNADKEIEDLKNSLDVLRYELQRSYVDYSQQVDEYVKQGTELYAEKLNRVALVAVLNKKYESLDSAIEALKKTDIVTAEVTIQDGFDLTAITEKLNDGMTKVPNGTVKDPSFKDVKDNEQLPAGLTLPAMAAIENIRDMLQNKDKFGAKRVYDKMKKMKLFPKELTFESFSAETDKPAE